MAGDDYVMVQLTEAGKAAADGGTLRISNGKRSFVFEAGKPLRVERSYEWLAVLRMHVTPNGKSLFELAPSAPAAASPSAPPTPTLTPAQEKK